MDPAVIAAGELTASKQAIGIMGYPPRLIPSALVMDYFKRSEVLYSETKSDLMGGSYANREQFVEPSLNNTSLKTEAPLETATPQAFVPDTLPLRNVVTPPELLASSGKAIFYELPAGVFSGGTGAIKLVAMRQDGSALPEWIKFDPVKGTFTVSLPREHIGPLEIKIEATDSKGEKAQTILKIQGRSQAVGFVGKPSITLQFDEVLQRSA